jgi:membrane protein insertase Oxa1/YidC/SpoIIIJ
MMLQWHLPSAFVLYWLASNVLYVAQQMYMNRKLDLPPLATPGDAGGSGAVVPAPAGGPAPNGGGDAKPLAPNARIISPKNRKRVRRK